MRFLKWPLIFISIVTFFSCNQRITTSISKSYPTLDYRERVLVLDINDSLPSNSEIIGKIKTGRNGSATKCNYEAVIDRIKLEARKVGGNAVKIVKHKPPTAFGNTCPIIRADILKIENVDSLLRQKRSSNIIDSLDYALFYVYRPAGPGVLLNYDLYLGDSVICRPGNKSKTVLKIHKQGRNTLWAKTETKTEIPINVEFGREYYIRCSLKSGIMVLRPSIEIVDTQFGKLEYNSVKPAVSKKDIIIRKNGDRIECDIIEEDENMVHFYTIYKGEKIKTFIKKNQIEEVIYSNK